MSEYHTIAVPFCIDPTAGLIYDELEIMGDEDLEELLEVYEDYYLNVEGISPVQKPDGFWILSPEASEKHSFICGGIDPDTDGEQALLACLQRRIYHALAHKILGKNPYYPTN